MQAPGGACGPVSPLAAKAWFVNIRIGPVEPGQGSGEEGAMFPGAGSDFEDPCRQGKVIAKDIP